MKENTPFPYRISISPITDLTNIFNANQRRWLKTAIQKYCSLLNPNDTSKCNNSVHNTSYHLNPKEMTRTKFYPEVNEVNCGNNYTSALSGIRFTVDVKNKSQAN